MTFNVFDKFFVYNKTMLNKIIILVLTIVLLAINLSFNYTYNPQGACGFAECTTHKGLPWPYQTTQHTDYILGPETKFNSTALAVDIITPGIVGYLTWWFVEKRKRNRRGLKN